MLAKTTMNSTTVHGCSVTFEKKHTILALSWLQSAHHRVAEFIMLKQ